MPRFSALKIIVITLLCFQGVNLFAQEDSTCGQTDNKKAIELYKKGTDKHKYQKEEREAFLKQAIQMEPDYVPANFALAQEIISSALAHQTAFDPAVPYFLTIINTCPHYHSDPYYFVGIAYYEAGKYADAVKYLQKYLDYKDDDVKKFNKSLDGMLYEAKKDIKTASFYDNLLTKKVPFDPHMVKGLCTNYDEYLAAISPDNQLAFYTRRMPIKKDMNAAFQAEDNMKEYFMMSRRQNDLSFDNGKILPPPFNMGRNEGGPSITIDNNHLFFTICKASADGGANCDLYYCDFAAGKWTDIKNLGQQVNDPDSWDSQPSISSDGVTLYFASNRPGGLGKCDLYKTIKDSTGVWGPAQNLGNGINTAGNEKSPFLHTDSHTLYFSSDGWPGVGGFDIFYSRMDSLGKWMEPKNIGYPINSESDEVGFFVSTDGNTGYFCSNDPNRTNGENMGGFDIYQFALYKEARPEKVALLKGNITDNEGNKITGATITITNTKTHKTAAVINDTVNATFAAVVNESKNEQYVVSINKKGYAFNSAIITSKDTFTGKPVDLDFSMKTLASGGNYVLHDIYYKTGSAQLEAISQEVIREFAKFMKSNPAIKVKIAGYTDNIGSERDNQALSSDRAYTVMQALAKEGIKGERLSFQGFGASNPVASNDTEEGRAKNRRTEFIIIQK